MIPAIYIDRTIPAMTEPPQWSREMTMTLIGIYKNHECLWNKSSVNYRNRQMKSAAILDISVKMQLHAEEILRKLHNLRCQLNTEIRKIVKKRKDGIPCESSWDLFDALRFMSDTEIPPVQTFHKVFKTEPTLRKFLPSQKHKSYQMIVKQDVLDDLIEVKYELDDNSALYPYVQLDADEDSNRSDHNETVTLYSAEPEVVSASLGQPKLKRLRIAEPDDELPISPADVSECSTSDLFVDNPMADDGEDEARALGDFVSAEMRRIRSETRRKSLRKTIEEAVKAMVEEDEKEFFQDPATDPLS